MHPVGQTISNEQRQINGSSPEGIKDVYTTIENKTFDEERALYGSKFIHCVNCKFDGPQDGESAFKECNNIRLSNCELNLRYPIWHTSNCIMDDCRMPETCRASLWYDKNVTAKNCQMHGIKAFRECEGIQLEHCDVLSEEFMWNCKNIQIKNTTIQSVYPFMNCQNMEISQIHMTGKYCFQYSSNIVIRDSFVDTKDAFWHGTNITIYDSVVKGEYLAWYSKGLHLIRCKIEGTQPFCYADGLVLEDCEMKNTDLSFEFSNVHATIKGEIESVKNPKSGSIEADSIKTIIYDKMIFPENECKIILRNANTK